MDARIVRSFVLLGAAWSLGASARTEHFIVSAPTPQIARQVADAAEHYRDDLAIEWTGRKLPPWADRCPIRVVLNRPASGETSFEFPVGGGHPRRWRMTVEGSLERILDSVLPHEILHTVFATHFQNPLPRWADEGACTTVEGATERRKHDHMLIRFLQGEDGIPFNEMFRMREYPRKILPLYSQGYSVASYLIHQGGKQKFVAYVGEGMQTNNWTAATRKFYDYSSLSDLQVKWVAWVADGSPPIRARAPVSLVASNDRGDSANRGGRQPVAAQASANLPQAATSRTAAMPREATIGRAGAPPQRSLQQPRPLPEAPQPPTRVLDDSGWYTRQARQGKRSGTSNRSLAPPVPGVGGPLWNSSRATNTLLR